MFHFSQSAFHVYSNKLHELRKVFQLLCLVMTLLAQGHRSLPLPTSSRDQVGWQRPLKINPITKCLGHKKMAVLYNWMIFFFLFLLDFLVLLAGKVTGSRWSRRSSWFPNESDIFQMVRDQSRLQTGSPGSEITEILPLSSLAAVTKKGHLPKQSLRHVTHQVTAGLPQAWDSRSPLYPPLQVLWNPPPTLTRCHSCSLQLCCGKNKQDCRFLIQGPLETNPADSEQH